MPILIPFELCVFNLQARRVTPMNRLQLELEAAETKPNQV
jgi:hypothetical protein